MPGLCAAAVSSSSTADSILAAMQRRMVHYPWHHPVTAAGSPNLAVGAIVLEAQRASATATSEDGTLTAVLYGEFFGSEDLMDYTIIGAEANLAARLQYLAEPGGIVISHETYVLVSDLVEARPLEIFEMKGIIRDIIPYSIDGFRQGVVGAARTLTEQAPGLDLRIDLDRLDTESARRARDLIERALAAVDRRALTPRPAGE